MNQSRIKPSSILIPIIFIVLLVKCASNLEESYKRAQQDPRVQERHKQVEEDLHNRLLDQHFEEDSRRKR